MNYFLLTRHDGGVEIMLCVGDTTPPKEIAKWPPGRRARIASWRPFDPTEAPPDRTFRAAWRCQGHGKPLGVCMDTARAMHRARMRQVREPLLKKLDVEYQRADEVGGTERKKEIASQKQALRDCTKHPDIEAAQTPEELARVWPEELRPLRPAP